MTKMETFIRNNFNLNREEMELVPRIVSEIQGEIDSGCYDDNGMGEISEYTLYDVFDDKLFNLKTQLLKGVL